MPDKVRFIDSGDIIKAVAKLCIETNTCLGEDIRAALLKARANETKTLAQSALDTILENAAYGEQEKLPLCQDTGIAVIFISVGSLVHIEGDINEAINEGVRLGYREGYLRNSVVRDPIRRVNTGDNTPAVIHYDFHPGDTLKISVAPKGFGSENMSAVKMFNPSDALPAVEEFILAAVKAADASPCPPVIVGAGIGGTMEKAALLAKKALLRDVGTFHPDPFWARAEERLLDKINALNIGPAGYGGNTTALGVHIQTYPTHIAGLPVAVNIGCHATRHKTVIL